MVSYSSNSKFVSQRSSFGVVRDYYEEYGVEKIHTPPTDYDILYDMFISDSVINTAFEIVVEYVTQEGYDFVSESKDKIDKARETFFDFNFDEVLDTIIYSLLIYGDAFLELRKIGGEIKELWVLETSEMVIQYNENGKVVGYIQRPRHAPKEGQKLKDDKRWKPDNIIHFTYKKVGHTVFSETPLASVTRSFTTRLYAQNFLNSIFINLPPKLLFHLQGANKVQRGEFIETLRLSKRNPHIDIVSYGPETSKIQFQDLTPQFNSGLMSVLEYLREEVLAVTRVPGMLLGITDSDGANRGTGELMMAPFEAHVKKIQHRISNKINRELMEKIGFKETKYRFNPLSHRDEGIVLENVEKLYAIGAKPSGVAKYLHKHGMNILEEDDFMERPDPTEMMGQGIGGPKAQIQSDNAPSRKREDKRGPMTTNINKAGVSDSSGKKIKQESKKVR